jgi:Flp pilus assembly protein TadD
LDKGHDDGNWIFKGDLSQVSGTLKEIPNLPVVTMAEDEKQLLVVDRNGTIPEQRSKYEKDDLLRWNDYGIGLLLQGDLKAAEATFLRVTEIDPSYADGWVNVGRVRIQEGNTVGAQQVLRKALDLTASWQSQTISMLSHSRLRASMMMALLHLRKALANYPRDRVVRNQAVASCFSSGSMPRRFASLRRP